VTDAVPAQNHSQEPQNDRKKNEKKKSKKKKGKKDRKKKRGKKQSKNKRGGAQTGGNRSNNGNSQGSGDIRATSGGDAHTNDVDTADINERD
jgi:hypothetical protein